MYFPYMRGKQFELSALKEVVPKLHVGKVNPIIEPVSHNLSKLCSTINELNTAGIIPHIVVNPEVGDLTNDSPDHLHQRLQQEGVTFIPCVRLYSQNIPYTTNLLNMLIDAGDAFSLYIQEEIQSNISSFTSKAIANVILSPNKYPKLFVDLIPRSVIISSAFPAKPRNADYSALPQFFSDAHLTYHKPLVKNQIGFGDYLTIDDTWSTSGGPAYVVALHITYIDKSNNGNMYVKHCLSISNPNDQSDPAGKFKEALKELINFAGMTSDLDKSTLGYQQYVIINNNRSYHGLGIPKKLSMMHHIETINNFL